MNKNVWIVIGIVVCVAVISFSLGLLLVEAEEVVQADEELPQSRSGIFVCEIDHEEHETFVYMAVEEAVCGDLDGSWATLTVDWEQQAIIWEEVAPVLTQYELFQSERPSSDE